MDRHTKVIGNLKKTLERRAFGESKNSDIVKIVQNKIVELGEVERKVMMRQEKIRKENPSVHAKWHSHEDFRK